MLVAGSATIAKFLGILAVDEQRGESSSLLRSGRYKCSTWVTVSGVLDKIGLLLGSLARGHCAVALTLGAEWVGRNRVRLMVHEEGARLVRPGPSDGSETRPPS